MSTGVLSGPRCRVAIIDPSNGIARYFGIYESINYGLSLDTQTPFILGRWTAASIDYTAVEPIQITCTGWRVVDHGPFTDGGMPRTQDLLTAQYLQLILTDRKTGKSVGVISDVRATSFSTGVAARQLSQLTVTYIGLMLSSDESVDNSEPASSTFLP